MMSYAVRNVSTGECNFVTLKIKLRRRFVITSFNAFQAILFSSSSVVLKLLVIDDVPDLLTTKMPSLILTTVLLLLRTFVLNNKNLHHTCLMFMTLKKLATYKGPKFKISFHLMGIFVRMSHTVFL